MCLGKTVNDRGTTQEHAREQRARGHGVYSSRRPLVSLASFDVSVVLMAKGIAVQKGEGGRGNVLVHGEEVSESIWGVFVVEYWRISWRHSRGSRERRSSIVVDVVVVVSEE